jgi:hypothetical protein
MRTIAYAYLNEICIDEHIHPKVIVHVYDKYFPEDNLYRQFAENSHEVEDSQILNFINNMETTVKEKAGNIENIYNLNQFLQELHIVEVKIMNQV